MTTEEQLKELRERWKTASPDNRKVIEMRAKLIQMSFTAPKKSTYEECKDIFLDNGEQLSL